MKHSFSKVIAVARSMLIPLSIALLSTLKATLGFAASFFAQAFASSSKRLFRHDLVDEAYP